MNAQWLWTLIVALGTKLPEAWPYVVGIGQNLKKIYDILGVKTPPKPLFGAAGKGKGKKALPAEARRALESAEASGVPAEAVQEVAGLLSVDLSGKVPDVETGEEETAEEDGE